MTALKSLFEQLLSPARDYQIRKKARTEKRFNIFELISTQYRKENLHSDVIAFLLNPEGLHHSKTTFLFSFLDCLEKIKPGLRISRESSIIVDREAGRIDVSILNLTTKEAIIIENKMNNAPDQDRQLLRYYEHLKNQGYERIHVVYLSLDGSKRPQYLGYTGDEIRLINSIMTIAPAVHADLPNLASDWLEKCCALTSDIDVLAMIRQYKYLLQTLYTKNMDYTAMEKLYRVIGESGDKYDTAITVRSMMDDLKEFLAERILRLKREKAQHVFSMVDLYKHNEEGIFAVFSGFLIDGFNLTIDVQVLEREYKLMFFERGGKLSGQNDPIKPIVIELGWENEVKYVSEINRYLKTFPIPGGESSLDEYLDKILDYFIRADQSKTKKFQLSSTN